MPDQPAALRRWHAVVKSKDPALLDELLADEVAFRSPAVFAAGGQGADGQLPERGAEGLGSLQVHHRLRSVNDDCPPMRSRSPNRRGRLSRWMRRRWRADHTVLIHALAEMPANEQADDVHL